MGQGSGDMDQGIGDRGFGVGDMGVRTDLGQGTSRIQAGRRTFRMDMEGWCAWM